MSGAYTGAYSVAYKAARGYTNSTRPSGYLCSILQNGVGRPVKQLSRLTLKFCETSKDSLNVRRFVEDHLINFAVKHPTVVVYALSESEADPQVCAEYLNGNEEIKELYRLDCDDILETLETFTGRSGLDIIRIRRDSQTFVPSIQGQWHPFYHKKDYDITKKLNFSTKLHDAWEPVGNPWKSCYRRHELKKLSNRPKLTFEEKSKLPLGKWAPQLPLRY